MMNIFLVTIFVLLDVVQAVRGKYCTWRNTLKGCKNLNFCGVKYALCNGKRCVKTRQTQSKWIKASQKGCNDKKQGFKPWHPIR
jgi:hypothetical protein